MISELWPYTPRDVTGGGRGLLADKRCIWLRNQMSWALRWMHYKDKICVMHLSWQQLFLKDLVALKILQVISESWPYTPRDVLGGGRGLLVDKRCIWLRNQMSWTLRWMHYKDKTYVIHLSWQQLFLEDL